MSGLEYLRKYAYYYIYAIAFTLALNICLSSGASQVSARVEDTVHPVLIIDPGHGGIDGGTTSCTGVLESTLNLEIARRLNSIFRLMGYETVMTRSTPDSIATQGDTIREQKVSDLKNRVQIVNSASNGILISIHQNFYPQSQYSGPQVFYSTSGKELAESIQQGLNTLSKGRDRSCKKAEGIYMMEHITAPGVLIECGFLSNPQEEALLRQPEYQKKLCAVIACSAAEYLEAELIS